MHGQRDSYEQIFTVPLIRWGGLPVSNCRGDGSSPTTTATAAPEASSCFTHGKERWYEPTGRGTHSSAVVWENLLLWVGD